MLYSCQLSARGCDRCAAAYPARPQPEDTAIDADAHTQQSDLIVGLVNLLERNRLALVVLAASLTAGARSRAREAYAESAAARWLARNARTVRHFLASLSILRLCARHAGYRALGRAGGSHRLVAAPRMLTLCSQWMTPSLEAGHIRDMRLRALALPRA